VPWVPAGMGGIALRRRPPGQQNNVRRLWRVEGLQVGRTVRANEAAISSIPRIAVDAPNALWGSDFQSDLTVDGTAARIAAIVDEHHRRRFRTSSRARSPASILPLSSRSCSPSLVRCRVGHPVHQRAYRILQLPPLKRVLQPQPLEPVRRAERPAVVSSWLMRSMPSASSASSRA
jgi:hypothetical protein